MNRKAKVEPQNKVLSGFWQKPLLQQAVLFIISFLLYANTLSHDYTQDDAIVIYDNMFTTQGVEGFPGILQNDTFYGFFKEEGKAKLVAGGRYRPLTQLMFALEWELFGRNPFVGHLFNVLLFACLVLLLYQTCKLLFRSFFDPGQLALFSFFTALLFAVHPIHTEVVANIKGRDEIMSLLLSLGTLWLVLQYLAKGKISFLLAAIPVFLSGLLSKENAVTFVAVIPLALYLFRKIKWKQHLLILSGLLGVTLLFMIIRTSVLGWDFGSKSMELMNNPFLKLEGSKYVDFSFGEKSATIFYTLGKYIQLLIFPHPLTHDYYPRQIGIMDLANWRVILSFLAYAFLTVYSILRFNKQKVVVFGILFFLFTLSIVSNIVFPIGTNMSERFLFMPSVGFTIIVAWFFVQYRKKYSWIMNALVLIIIVGFGAKTVSRNEIWKDDFTLFTTDVETSSNSAKVNNAAGGALVSRASEEKRPVQRKKMLNQAIEYLDKAISIHPGYKNPYLIKGNAQYYLGEYTEAIKTYDQVLKFAPGFEEAEKNLAISHREAGKDAGMNKSDLQKALYHLRIASQMMPDDYETERLTGIANALSGNFEAALIAFKKAIELDPDNAGAYQNLGNVYYNLGDIEQGEYYHQKAVELDPGIFDNNK